VEAAKALSFLLEGSHSRHAVIALPPSGLMRGYWRVVKRSTWKTVVLTDEPEAILRRITFYDIDSNPIRKELSDEEKRLYLKEIKKDISYFRKSYERADCRISIAGLDADEAARKVSDTLQAIDSDTGNHKRGNSPSPCGG
jgi:shikimate kinase